MTFSDRLHLYIRILEIFSDLRGLPQHSLTIQREHSSHQNVSNIHDTLLSDDSFTHHSVKKSTYPGWLPKHFLNFFFLTEYFFEHMTCVLEKFFP